ncbi:MAG: bifunctional 23S rRNA (guanine(2069)-N(7))-methyltransferase RlmK/23S rRNA (guanine(2445)-N(2))-methyltransferase RlmL [Methylococcaceae bacterium]|nr:MAG: bifunctional 23S rRNA (guanine(2069)-N(7))-methyltransferase RlmK/23S rRNA (guanine(2445)-N(2))-methyltransferase RlmL [Methylococcaceae bacterium]
MTMYSLFASSPKALENLLADELQSLGAMHVKPTLAGVAFEGDLAQAYRVCLWSRIASRVFLLLSSFTVRSQQDLYDGIYAMDWSEHFCPEDSFSVAFSAKRSVVINNTHFGALKVKDAVVDQMRSRFSMRPSIDTDAPKVRINVHLDGEKAQVSIDLSGHSLHQRGYRSTTLEAPIKENLAAAILLRCGWVALAAKGASLVDPMCGSGTLLVEAALIAADYAPGLLRDYFGFLGWKQHDADCWQQLIDEAEQRKHIGMQRLPKIVGFDQSNVALSAATTHVSTAGLQNMIHLERREIDDAAPAKAWPAGLLVCNPPYGERLGDWQETSALYKKMGEILKAQFKGWQVGLIISQPELGFRLGIRSHKPITLFNGALECKLLRFKVEESAFFIPKASSSAERLEHVYAQHAELLANTKPVTEQHENLQPIVRPPLPSPDSAKEESVSILSLASENEENKAYEQDASSFINRLNKNCKKMAKWAQRTNTQCYRVYDADLPEYSVAIDVYYGEQLWLNVQEYEPPKTIDAHKATQRLACILAALPKVFNIDSAQIFLKIRRKQRHSEQYEKQAEQGHFHCVEEAGCRLLVNFEDYLDTGLFLDHRPLRKLIQQQAKDKRFLNLFAYTGSATVHAAVGGAKSTTSVDMSHTYLHWAKNNLAENKCAGEHVFIQADCLTWLAEITHTRGHEVYDVIFMDPPTFSNSKRMNEVFDIQKQHVFLIQHALKLLASDGVLYFSTNFRRFKLEEASLVGVNIQDITAATIPEDFSRNPKIHYCWRIKHAA